MVYLSSDLGSLWSFSDFNSLCLVISDLDTAWLSSDFGTMCSFYDFDIVCVSSDLVSMLVF